MTDWTDLAPGLRIVRRGTVSIRHVQLYGPRCSGTHFAAALLRANFGAAIMTEAYGFKHWFVPPQVTVADDTLVLVLARDAADWVCSLHRQPWHAHPALRALDFARFIRAEWVSLWDADCPGVTPAHPLFLTEMAHERCPETGRRFANCVAKRTAKLRHWLALERRAANVALLSYEALRDDPVRIVRAIGGVMACPTRDAFVGVESYKGQGERPFRPTAYPPLAAADADHLRSWLDPELEAMFGLWVA